MTEQEAIKSLQFFKKEDAITKLFRGVSPEVVTESQALIDLCMDALEKQIPKKPNRTSRPYECPTCGSWEGVRSSGWYLPPHCCMCGQKLDWSDSND